MDKGLAEQVKSMEKGQHVIIPWSEMEGGIIQWYNDLYQDNGLSSCHGYDGNAVFRKDHYRHGDILHGNNRPYLEKNKSETKEFLTDIIKEVEGIEK